MVASTGGNTALIENLIKALDANNDGFVDKEEFKSLAY